MTAISYKDAVAEARHLFQAFSRTNELPLLPKGIDQQGGLKTTGLAVSGLKRIQTDPAALISDSRRYSDAFDALRYGAAFYLALEKELPSEVRNWVISFLQGKVQCPTRSDGTGSKLGLHSAIFVAVSMLKKKGMTATRNDASPPYSACDAVAEALKGLGMEPTTYPGVKKIYWDLKKHGTPDGSISLTKAYPFHSGTTGC